MKTSIITLMLFSISYTFSFGQESMNVQTAINTIENTWDIDKIDVGQIIILDDIQFEMDESELHAASQKALVSLVDFMNKNKTVKIELRGHTNNIPPHKYCDELSSKRAEAVKSYLIEHGVNPENLTANGYGKRLPINSNLHTTGRDANQRVDVKILVK